MFRYPLYVVLLVFISVSQVVGQLLYNETPLYENYGIQGYRHYGRGLIGRSTEFIYDDLGEFLMDGIPIYTLREDRVVTELVPPGSVLNKHFLYWGYLSGLAIASDKYNGLSTRLLIGDHIRTHFTPLTLDLAALNGIRWDLDTGKQRTSIVVSRRDRPIWRMSETGRHLQMNFATYLLGGHWEMNLGPLKIGATYTNQYRVDSLIGLEWNDFRGATPLNFSPVQLLVVKFANANEQIGSNVRIFDVRLTLNGQPTDIRPVVTRHDSRVINPNYPNGDRFFPIWQSIPPFVEFILGAFPQEQPGPQGYVEARDTEYLLYWFELPEDIDIDQASFDALVANNYAIYVSEVFAYLPYLPKTDPGERNRATYFYQVAGTKKAVSDMSNLDWVHFDYGRQTSNMVFGINAESNVKGFQFKGEYNVNLNYLQYPNPEGARSRRSSTAYFLNVRKDLNDHLAIGGEYLNMDPDYSTKITVHDEGYISYTADPGAPYGSADIPHGFRRDYNNTIEMDTVDDNDDKDPFPDFYFILSEGDNDGIFPGSDEDLDGRPDINENNNTLPDYIEPFMLYAVDPDEFVYGDDLNNNSVIDVREDDRKSDYPYDQNLRGFHLFTQLKPIGPLILTAGHYDTRQIWGGGQNEVTYTKLDYQRDFTSLATVQFVDFLKWVRDNIRNDVYRFTYSNTGFETIFYEDALYMQNSLVNTAFVKFRLYRFRPFYMGINALHEVNQQKATYLREVNWIRRWSIVFRSDYTWQFGPFSVMPQTKFMVQKIADDRNVIKPAHELFFYPIFRVVYELAPNTTLRLGAQGFPFLKSRFINLINEEVNYESQDYIVSLSNVSSYSGYLIGLNVGYQLKLLRMMDRKRRFEDRDYTFFFIRLIVSLRPTT